MIAPFEQPATIASRTNSRSLSDSTSPRTTRAVCIHEVMPMTKMMFHTDRPSTEARTMAKGRNGMTRNHSVNLISTRSKRPPRNPETIPTNDPMKMVSTVAANPTNRLTLDPQTNCAHTERRM